MLFIIILFFVNILGGVEISDEVSIPDNPIKIFDHGLSHGVGVSVLDSPLLKDSLNAHILIGSRNGIDGKELRQRYSEIKELDNRINALLQSRLLYQDQDQFYTSFPILIGEDHKQYFQMVKETVDKVYPTFLPSLHKILSEIDQRGWNQWSYHIIWSLIFDSQFAWYEMVDRGLVPPLAPPIEWVIYPQASYKTGTNYYPDTELKDFWVVVSWSPNGSNTLGLLGGSWQIIYDAALGQSDSLNSQNKRYLMELGLMNDQYEVTFPVIFSEDDFFNELKNTVDIELDLFEGNIPIDEFSQIIGRDENFSWAVAYHDICWEILKRLVGDGHISKPAPLKAKNTSFKVGKMVGVSSVISVYKPFVDQILEVLEK